MKPAAAAACSNGRGMRAKRVAAWFGGGDGDGEGDGDGDGDGDGETGGAPGAAWVVVVGGGMTRATAALSVVELASTCSCRRQQDKASSTGELH